MKKSIVVKYIPEAMHRSFKQRCVEHGVSMTEALVMFINRVERSDGSIIEEWKAQDRQLELKEVNRA